MFNPRTLAIFLAPLLLAAFPAKADLQERALRALQQLAKDGSTRALYELGRRYETGVGVALDLETAFEHYCAAAAQGHPGAAYSLARLYLTGQGVEEDRRDAAAWALEAIAAGHPFAHGLLAGLDAVEPTLEPACDLDLPGVLKVEAPESIDRLVRKMAPEYGLDAELVLAVIHAESGFRPRARSERNAHGLMQLIPATAKRFGVRNLMDPAENLRGGMRYLQWLMAYFRGDVRLVLAAYNAGEGAVDRYRGIPPYKQTRDYVAKIRAFYPRDRHPYEAELASRASRAATEAEVASLD